MSKYPTKHHPRLLPLSSLLTLRLSPPPFHLQLTFPIAHNRDLPINTLHSQRYSIQSGTLFPNPPFAKRSWLYVAPRSNNRNPQTAKVAHQNPRHNPPQDLARIPHWPHRGRTSGCLPGVIVASSWVRARHPRCCGRMSMPSCSTEDYVLDFGRQPLGLVGGLPLLDLGVT